MRAPILTRRTNAYLGLIASIFPPSLIHQLTIDEKTGRLVKGAALGAMKSKQIPNLVTVIATTFQSDEVNFVVVVDVSQNEVSY